MQLNVVFIATALLASASLAISVTVPVPVVTVFDGANCTGKGVILPLVLPDVCFGLGADTKRSIGYSNIPNEIQFFVSNGVSPCTNPPQLIRNDGSGCATAPDG